MAWPNFERQSQGRTCGICRAELAYFSHFVYKGCAGVKPYLEQRGMEHLRAAKPSHGNAARSTRRRIATILAALALAVGLWALVLPSASLGVDLTDVARPAAMDQPQIN